MYVCVRGFHLSNRWKNKQNIVSAYLGGKVASTGSMPCTIYAYYCTYLDIVGGGSVCICMTARSELRRRQKNEKIENRSKLSEKQIKISLVLFVSSFPVETRNSGYNCDLKKN